MSETIDPIVVVLEMEAPVERVWRAITTPSEIASWWAAGDIAPHVGHEFTLDMGPFGIQPCEVLAVVDERSIRYRFTDDWELEWRLEPMEGRTRLTMVHSGFDPANPRDAFAHEHMGTGWREQVLPALAGHVAHRSVD